MLWFSWIACAPIDAPEDFDALNSYLYENFESPDRYLEKGMENLIAWLPENEADLAEGYRVSNLTAEAIATVDQVPSQDLIGIALSREYNHDVDAVAYASFAVDPEDLVPDSKGFNRREYLTDTACFLSHDCDVIQYTAEVQNFLPLGVEVITYIFSEARWVETDLGTAYIQRRWQTQTPEVSVDWVHVNAEYGFIITLPQPKENEEVASTVKRIEASWLDMTLDGLPIPEDLAVQLALGSLRDSIDITNTYLDNNPVD